VNPSFPIYVPSKGRSDSRLTIKALARIGVPYRVVVEPIDQAAYSRHVEEKHLLVMPSGTDNQGLVPTRNWIWEHAISEGHKRHWQLDDNIKAFYRFNRNLKVPVASGSIFAAAEEFVERYENVALAGFHYFMFVSRKSKVAPFTPNSRIYSCTLVLNRLPFRYRDVFNDDTDISLRVLKAGWCTILFNAFLQEKSTTMTVKGGMTPLYQGDGRLEMARSLQRQHPDVTRLTQKWGRWQHHVDYRPFKKNHLVLKDGVKVADGSNEFGMKLVKVK
jgi:hypothetical protein